MEQLDNKKQNQPWEITISLKLLGNLFFYWWFLVVIYGLYTLSNIIVFGINIHDGLITFISFMIFVIITLTISYSLIIKIIILTSRINKPIPKILKIKLFFSPLLTSSFLLFCYLETKEWDYSKFKVTNANLAFEEAKFQYLPDLVATKEYNSKSFKYLQKKFENVAVVLINEEFERYRIGSMDKDAILGKDYLIVQNNIINYNFWGLLLHWYHNKISFECYYSLVQEGARKSIMTFKQIKDNVYVAVFFRYSFFMIFGLSKNTF